MPDDSFEVVEHPVRTPRSSRTTSGTGTRGNQAASVAGSPAGPINQRSSRSEPVGGYGAEPAPPTAATEHPPAGQVEHQRRIEELDGIVDRFRSGQLNKPKAIALVLRTIEYDPDSSDRAQEQTLELYLSAINSHETALTESARRGAPYGEQLGEERQVAGELLEPQRDPDVDRRVNDLLSELSAKSVAADPGDDDDGDRSSKRPRLALSDMPWYKDELENRESDNPICRKNRELLALFARDIPQVKFWIRNSAHAPSGFPTSQWERIIRGEAVDLNAVFSNLHRTEPAKENVGRVGDTQITFGLAEPKKRIETAGDWISAWNRVVQATRFVFRHREQELRSYGDYIESLFAAKIVATHPRIIMFDIAVRNEVAGGQRSVLFDASSRFHHLYAAIVAADGVEAKGRSGTRGQSGGSSKNNKPTVCHRFNSAAGCNSTDCRFQHACRICRSTDHSSEKCDRRGRQ
jgi:hypothetical protein